MSHDESIAQLVHALMVPHPRQAPSKQKQTSSVLDEYSQRTGTAFQVYDTSTTDLDRVQG